MYFKQTSYAHHIVDTFNDDFRLKQTIVMFRKYLAADNSNKLSAF